MASTFGTIGSRSVDLEDSAVLKSNLKCSHFAYSQLLRGYPSLLLQSINQPTMTELRIFGRISRKDETTLSTLSDLHAPKFYLTGRKHFATEPSLM